jgi:hypothetical protein
MPKHVAFLIDVNNKEFDCVRLNVVYHLYMKHGAGNER